MAKKYVTKVEVTSHTHKMVFFTVTVHTKGWFKEYDTEYECYINKVSHPDIMTPILLCNTQAKYLDYVGNSVGCFRDVYSVVHRDKVDVLLQELQV